MEKVIRKRMLCWTAGQLVESGGPGTKRKVYQNGKPYYVTGSGSSGYVILREA